MKNVFKKNFMIFIIGLLLGFFIRHLLPFSPEDIEVIGSGLNVHTVIGTVEDRRGFELSENPIAITEYILWYDWQSNIFALDSKIFESDFLADNLWNQGGMFVIKVDGIIAHGLAYRYYGAMPRDGAFIPVHNPTIFRDRVFFYGDKENLGGYDGSAARLYSIELPGFGGTLNSKIYTELYNDGRLLEQISNRYILTEFDNIVGQSAESWFTVEHLSIITFKPSVMRATATDPIVVQITEKNTGEVLSEFTHLFSRSVSFVMDAGKYGIYVSGGGFVADSYIVSGIELPQL